MDAKQIQRLRPELERYLGQFDDCFGRCEPAEHLQTYVTGQLSDLPRKSVEPMAEAAGQCPRNLQHFLALHAWDEMKMRDRVHQVVARDHRHSCSIGVIDDTGHPKKGDKTPGVQRQWCGNTGKVENCVVTVHLSYAAGDFHTLLAGELFLPEEWSQDRQRCRAAGIPEAVVHRPKWRIALQLRDQAVANGVRFEWMTADEGYGEVPAFHFALDDCGQRYVLEVPRSFHGWLRRPEVLEKQCHRPQKRGPKPRYPRLKVRNLPTIEAQDMVRYGGQFRTQPWQKFYVKDSTLGPVVWEAKAAPIYLKRDGLPTRAHWLMVARNVLDPSEVKYFVSNAPAGTPLEVLLHVAFQRFHVERCFEEEKGELGMDHFEVRNWRSLRRHLILTSVTHLFLARVHQKWRGKKSATNGLPTAHRILRPCPILVADGRGPTELPRAHSAHYQHDTRTTGPFSTQPRQEKEAALA